MRQANDTKTSELALPVPMTAGLLGALITIPLDLVDAEDQVRQTSGLDESLDELAESIKQHGILTPILVRQVVTPDAMRFMLIAGHRRTFAAHLAGLTKIPAVVMTDADADKVLELQLTENIQREQLELAELAKAVRRLFDRHGDLGKVAEIVKKSKPWVSKHLALSFPEFSHTARYLLSAGATNDLELLHTINQIEKTGTAYYDLHQLVDRIKAGKAGRKEARELLAKAKAQKDANQAAAKAVKRASTPHAPVQALKHITMFMNVARDLEYSDDAPEVDELLKDFTPDDLAAIDADLPSQALADSHAKGAALNSAPWAVQLRALATQRQSFTHNAAFVLGLQGLPLNARNYLVEAREISRLADAE